MLETGDSESRKLLRRLKETLAESSAGQARLDRITQLIATSMRTEVCLIYLFRDADTLELCATEGLKPEAVHQTRMRLGEGLVGRVARDGRVVNEADAPSAKGFRSRRPLVGVFGQQTSLIRDRSLPDVALPIQS